MKRHIITPNGKYTYTFVPIFEGVKRIDKHQAKENLFLFKEIVDKYNLKFLLAFGTLLGAVREHDFIDHDEDIDLIMMKSDMDKFLSLLFEFRKYGFEVIRYERRGFLSLMRKGEYIDFYFYEPYPENKDLMYCCQDIFPKKLLEDTAPITFLGRNFNAPRDYKKMMEISYGKDWMTPVEKFDFKLSKYERLKQWLKQYIKVMLPVSFVERKQMEADKPFITKYIKRIQQLG